MRRYYTQNEREIKRFLETRITEKTVNLKIMPRETVMFEKATSSNEQSRISKSILNEVNQLKIEMYLNKKDTQSILIVGSDRQLYLPENNRAWEAFQEENHVVIYTHDEIMMLMEALVINGRNIRINTIS